MKKHLYEIKRLDMPAYLKWWFIKYKFGGILSEVMENLTSPITLTNGLRRRFKIFEIGGNSVQDGTPTPESPISIQNVGDNVNLFDKDNANILNAYADFTTSKITTSANSKLAYLEITGGKTYTVSKILSKRFRVSTTAELPAIDVATLENIQNDNGTSITITTSNSAKYLCIGFYYAIADTLTEQEILNSIKIEEGLTPTGYSPFGCGSVDVKVEKGLFNKNNIEQGAISYQVGRDYTDCKTTNLTRIRLKELIKLDTTKNTIISWNSEVYDLIIQAFNENQVLYNIGGISNKWYTNSQISITNIPYIAIAIKRKSNENITVDEIDDVDLKVYDEEQTVTFLTKEEQVIHLSDTLEDDGVHQRRFTRVLDGTENYNMATVDEIYRFTLGVNNSVASSTRINVLSSHFIYAESGNAVGIVFLNHQNIYMYPETDITTVAEFKAWLAEQYANGTPVTLEYELAEEIIVPYNEEQQKAYDKIKALKSYEGTTYISSDNEPSPTFTIQYVKEE